MPSKAQETKTPREPPQPGSAELPPRILGRPEILISSAASLTLRNPSTKNLSTRGIQFWQNRKQTPADRSQDQIALVNIFHYLLRHLGKSKVS